MTKVRPYFKLGIADLESIFDAARTDKVICQALIEELAHRSTERATALLKRIESEKASAASGISASGVAAREQVTSPKAEPTPKPKPPPTAPVAVPVSSSVAKPSPAPRVRPVVSDKPNAPPVAMPAKEGLRPAQAPQRELPTEETSPPRSLPRGRL